METINKRIDEEFCINTYNKISDSNLLDDYVKSKSVKNKINKLTEILKKYQINDDTVNCILSDYMIDIIPPGTKSVIKGIFFNKIIKEHIENLNLDKTKYDICFEKKCKKCTTDEIPDWYILEKKTNKLLIGMNQIDLFSGGHQLNRGFKYLIDCKYNNDACKLICVICKHTHFKRTKSKSYKLFQTGFSNNSLCYIKNLSKIIYNYFNI